MTQQTIVALFRTVDEAEAAQRQLEAAGIPSSDISLRSGPMETAATTEQAPHERSFWAWLFGAEPSAAEVQRYRSHVAQGGAALSVRVDDRDIDRVSELLEQHDLVAIEEAKEYDTGAAPAGEAGEETVLPTAREELEVGKRQVSDTRHFRIRRYVVERPAEERVALRDETVTVERRTPASAAPGAEPFEEKIVEVTETREEPVVTKRVVPGEEVVVRKDQKDRVETVRDKVRESRVEVDRAAAGDKPTIPPKGPPTGETR
jgi:stress response protein YsnF